eukprot:m.486373 g.486373  ORF g.486373 m.486373 type:complete len:353 (-) comp24362_c0_seq1:11-1069(-)
MLRAAICRIGSLRLTKKPVKKNSGCCLLLAGSSRLSLVLLELVQSQLAQPGVAPRATVRQALDGVLGANGSVDDAGRGRALPLTRVLLLLADSSNVATVQVAVMLHAVCVEVNRLEWSHERPPQTKPLGHGRVDIVRAGNSVLDEAPCFHEEGILQAVDNKAVDFLLDKHWRLSQLLHDLLSLVNDFLRRPWRRHNLNQRNVVRGVDRVRHNALGLVCKPLGEDRWLDARRAAGKNDRIVCEGIKLGEDFLLEIHVFGDAFLHVDSTTEGLFQLVGARHARGNLCNRLSLEKPRLFNLSKLLADALDASRHLGLLDIVKHDVKLGACKEHGPAPPDHTASDHCNLARHLVCA